MTIYIVTNERCFFVAAYTSADSAKQIAALHPGWEWIATELH